MRKIVLLIAALVMTSICVTSCLKDSENTAEIYYIGMATGINYEDSADTIWENNIVEALNTWEIFNTTFVERDTSTSGIASLPIYNCNIKAVNYFKKMIAKRSLSDVKKSIFNAHADSLVKIGVPNADSISLKPFTLYSSIYSVYQGTVIYTDSTNIN